MGPCCNQHNDCWPPSVPCCDDCPAHEFYTGCNADCPDDCMADHRGEE